MAFQTLLSHLRTNMQYFAALGACSLYTASIYPQVWGIKNYMKLVQFYRDGEPLQLDEANKSLTQEVLDKMKLHLTAEANVQVFTAYGQDPLNKGSTFSTNGGLVGLPIYLTYKSVDDVEKNKMTVMDHAIDWESVEGSSFLESLILSANAKRFILAREISYIDTHHVQLRAFLVSGYFTASYMAGFLINKLTRLPSRAPLLVRGVVYSMIGTAGYVAFSIHNDAFSSSRDFKADKRAAKLGKEFAEGGVEFYEKTLQRNKALRSMLKQLGPRLYTAYGNNMQSWRSPNLPLTTRRDNLVAMFKSYSKDSNEDDEVTL